MSTSRSLLLATLLAGCTPQAVMNAEDGNVSSTDEALRGCHGHASSTIPADDRYVLTTFGAVGEAGQMSCGQYTRSGSWYYIASRQRFGCGAHVKIEANGKCVVAEADDYGPDVCVENAAGRAIIDASPKVSKALWGISAAGWSEHRLVTATVVADSTPLGACTPSGTSTTDTTTGDTGETPTTCASYTLGIDVPLAECVQSKNDHDWYQCTTQGWVQLDGQSQGPLGACTATHPLP